MQRLYIAVDMTAYEIGYSYVVSVSLRLRLSMRRLTSMAVRGRERGGTGNQMLNSNESTVLARRVCFSFNNRTCFDDIELD